MVLVRPATTRNRQKNLTLSEADRHETGKCILCQQQDSQEHTFHHCQNIILCSIRDEIRVNLNKHIHTYGKDCRLQHQVGRAMLELLDNTDEPGRVWLGNLSISQITILSGNILPDLLKDKTQSQLNKIFLGVSRILAEGAKILLTTS